MKLATKAPRSKARGGIAPRAHYEGAHGSRLRSNLPGVVQEARKDLTRATRRELIRTSRALWKNNPMVKGVVERLVTYTVGTGLRPEPNSSRSKFNRIAAEKFEQWAKFADLSSPLSFYELQAIIFRSTIVDGDVFANETYGTSGRARIQLIEGHQVGSPTMPLYVLSDDGKFVDRTVDDGVIGDANGRPVNFIVQEPDGQLGFRSKPLDADYVVQFANIERPGQKRGAPMAAAMLTTAIDLHDILGLEKAAVKSASAKDDIIKTASGELPDDGTIGRSLRPKNDGSGKTAVEFYREIFGPEARVLKHGDEYQPYEPKRPGPAWQGFVDFLAELCCLTLNLPPSLVRQLKVGGADTRRDLATMQRVCEVWQAFLAARFQRIYEFVIADEMDRDPAFAALAPSDWRACDWQAPRAATVDAGRQSQADREDVRTGNMTLREQCGQYGVSWRKHIQQLAIEMREVMDLEKQFKLPKGSLITRLYGPPNQPILQFQPTPSPSDTPDDDEEQTPPTRRRKAA